MSEGPMFLRPMPTWFDDDDNDNDDNDQPEPYRPPDCEPKYKVGDAVTAFNGEPRIVTGMNWGQSRRRVGCPDDPVHWGWVLDTVHPDDPKCLGTGFEHTYKPRTP